MTTGYVQRLASHSWESVDAVNRIPLLLLLLHTDQRHAL